MSTVRFKYCLTWLSIALLVFPPVPVWGAELQGDSTGGFAGSCNGDGALGPAGEPCTFNGAHKFTPTIDGNADDWAGHSSALILDWTQNNVADPVGGPLVASVRYSWDDDNLYFLIEVTDDDPTTGPYTANDWCGDCDAGAAGTDAAPWNTDSIGFYDQNGQPSDHIGSPAVPGVGVPTYGPHSQFWVGFMSQASIDAAGGTAGSGDPHHMSRTTQYSGTAGYGEVFGPNAQRNEVSDPAVPAQSPLVTDVQSAFADDGTTRTTEFFMTWDQLRWDDNNPTGDADLTALLATHAGAQDGHYRDDVQEDYRFRLDPLILDNDGSFAWGSQGGVHGEDTGAATAQLEDQANVQLLHAADLNGDGFVEGLDLGILLASFGTEASVLQGNLNGTGIVDGLDLGILLGAWNPPPSVAGAVPEPATALLLLTSLGGLMATRRRRAAPRHRRE